MVGSEQSWKAVRELAKQVSGKSTPEAVNSQSEGSEAGGAHGFKEKQGGQCSCSKRVRRRGLRDVAGQIVQDLGDHCEGSGFYLSEMESLQVLSRGRR